VIYVGTRQYKKAKKDEGDMEVLSPIPRISEFVDLAKLEFEKRC